jgi:hypothetical protein
MNENNCVFYFIDKKLQGSKIKVAILENSISWNFLWGECKCSLCKYMSHSNRIRYIRDIYKARNFNVMGNDTYVVISLN